MSARIFRLARTQIDSAGATLARAFQDDPLMVYAIPDAAERIRLLPDVYARMIRFGCLAGEVYAAAGVDSEPLDGVALWMPPDAKWSREHIEAKGNIYVLNQFGGLSGNGSVTVYPAGSNLNASPTETIAGPDTQLSPPGGIAVDAAENIYVANQAGSTITEYPAGSNGDTTPIATIVGCASDNTEFACNPNGIAVDQVSGNIFVLNSGAGNPNIAEYAAGISGSNPATAIGLIQGSNTALNNVVASQGIALNPVNGDIYVSNLLGDNVLVYAAGIYGNVSPIAVIGGPDTFPGEGGVSPTGIASDSSGNIYVMNDNPPGITVYPAGSNGNVTPSTMIVGISNLFDGPGIAVGP